MLQQTETWFNHKEYNKQACHAMPAPLALMLANSVRVSLL